MAATLTVHSTDTPGTAILTEFTGPAGTGTVVPPIGPVTYSSSNPAVATVNATTGALTYVGAGTATITGTDAGSGLSATATLAVIVGAGDSAVLTLTPGA